MLEHDVLAVAFFPRPCRKSLPDSSGPGKETFAFPNAGKVFRSPECDLLHSPMPENSIPWSQARPPSRGQTFLACIEECKMSHSRDRKTFLGIWEYKRFPSRDLKSFLTWGNVKRSMGSGKNVLGSTAGLSILGMGIF